MGSVCIDCDGELARNERLFHVACRQRLFRCDPLEWPRYEVEIVVCGVEMIDLIQAIRFLSRIGLGEAQAMAHWTPCSFLVLTPGLHREAIEQVLRQTGCVFTINDLAVNPGYRYVHDDSRGR